MPRSFRSILLAGANLLAVALVALIALVAYAAYAERSGEQKAKQFCSTVTIGDSTERLSERAQSSGADERTARWIPVSNEERWLAVTFTGFTPISRHICSIKANENVTSVQYVYLD